jgi:hypothetical protein
LLHIAHAVGQRVQGAEERQVLLWIKIKALAGPLLGLVGRFPCKG